MLHFIEAILEFSRRDLVKEFHMALLLFGLVIDHLPASNGDEVDKTSCLYQIIRDRL